jgi:membrane fusion protein, multidrug efflux system
VGLPSIFSKLSIRLLGGLLLLGVLGFITWKGVVSGKQNENNILVQANLKNSDDQSIAPSTSASVKSVLSKAEERGVFLKVSGVTEAAQTLDVEVRASGTIKKILVQEGDFVKKGTILAQLKMEDLEQKLEVAKSLLKLCKMQHEAAERLSVKGFTSPISLASTKKNLSDAKLTVLQAHLEINHLKVKAPFSGIVNTVYVEPGTVISDMSADRKVCALVNLHPLYITIYVTEKIYEQLRSGSPVQVYLADGRVVGGKIDSISVVADPKTKTFEVSILVPNLKRGVPAGMSAVVEVPLKEKRTHKLHPSWVTLSKEGVMGVMGIEGGIAVFYPITIVDSSPACFYVIGLPDELEIITLGQEMVAAGAKVQAVSDTHPDEQ